MSVQSRTKISEKPTRNLAMSHCPRFPTRYLVEPPTISTQVWGRFSDFIPIWTLFFVCSHIRGNTPCPTTPLRRHIGFLNNIIIATNQIRRNRPSLPPTRFLTTWRKILPQMVRTPPHFGFFPYVALQLVVQDGFLELSKDFSLSVRYILVILGIWTVIIRRYRV